MQTLLDLVLIWHLKDYFIPLLLERLTKRLKWCSKSSKIYQKGVLVKMYGETFSVLSQILTTNMVYDIIILNGTMFFN